MLPVRSLALVLGLTFLATPPLASATEPQPQEVRLSLERYEKLMAQLGSRPGLRGSWSKGNATLTLPGDDGGVFARVEVHATVEVSGDGTAEIPLLPADVVLERAEVAGRSAQLMRSGGAYLVNVGSQQGAVNVQLFYLVPIQPSSAGQAAVVPLPPLPGATLTVVGADAETVHVSPGVVQARAGDRMTATLPGAAAVIVSWGDNGSGSQVRRVDYRVVPDASGTGVEVEATLDVRVSGAEAWVRVASATAALLSATQGSGDVVTAVSGDWHRARVVGKGKHALKVRFRLAIDRSEGLSKVHLSLDRRSITTVEVEVSGERPVTFEPTVPVLSEIVADGDKRKTIARVALPPSRSVIISWPEATAAPEKVIHINSETTQLITLEPGAIRSKVHMAFHIARGKAKELRIAYPDGISVTEVSGQGIEWDTFKPEGDVPRHILVVLGEERTGRFDLQLTLQGSAPIDEGAAINVPIVYPIAVSPNDHHVGVVALVDGDKVGFAQVEPTNYTRGGEEKVPVALRKDIKINQAFAHVGEPSAIKTTVTTEKRRELNFDARVETRYLVKEGVVVGNASVMVDVKSGRLDSLTLSLPSSGVKPLRWTFPNKNKEPEETVRDDGRTAYTLRFTRPVDGGTVINLEFEQLLDKDVSSVALPDVRVEGADVEEGTLGIAAEQGVEVTHESATDLRNMDVSELPNSLVLNSEREIRLGYKYPRGPWTLKLNITRHRAEATPQAVIESAWFETIMLSDGKRFTRAVFLVANDLQQYLRLETPAGFRPDSYVVDGERVKAGRDEDGILAIPLPKGKTVPVVVQYEEPGESLGTFGSFDLVALKPQNVKIRNVQWQVLRPAELSIWNPGGSLEVTSAETWRGPGSHLLGDTRLPLGPERLAELRSHVFTRDMWDPTEPALAVSLSYAELPGEWVGWVLYLLALVFLVLVVRRRVKTKGLGRAGWFMLVVGVAALVLKGLAWGIETGEGVGLVAILFVVAVLSTIEVRRARKREAGTDDRDAS